MKARVVTVLLALLLSTVACGPALVSSPEQRDPSPEVATSDLDRQVTGNTAFALDLYQALRKDEGNLFYSPYSISLALAMTYAGARGETEQQMAGTLHFVLPQEELHPVLNSLDTALNSRGDENEGLQLNAVNAIWGREGEEFLPAEVS